MVSTDVLLMWYLIGLFTGIVIAVLVIISYDKLGGNDNDVQ